jgi:uncharacterized iron-regulated protein
MIFAACATGSPVATPHNVTAPHAALSVAGAALPFAIVDGHTGHAVATADFWQALASAQLVCAGEEHPNPHHHWAQLAIVSHLVDATGHRAVGLEMIQTPFQGVVDDFVASTIDESTFLTRVGWDDRWGFDWALYQPTIETAKRAGWSVRALNAPSDLVKRVSKVGVAGLDPIELAKLPTLVLTDTRHRAWFDGVMAEMGDHGGANTPSADNMYAAQVVWDESMAEGAVAWLAHGDAIVVLAGNGHCHDTAIVGRAQRRGIKRAISVRPIVDDGDGNVAAALAEGANDYLFIMTPPTD